MEENKWNELKQLNDTKQLNQLTSPGIKIGIYGSSFDPITNVHLWTASTVAHRKKLDYIIFLPSSNKRTDKRLQITDDHRVAMIQKAISTNPKFLLDTYELNVLPGYHYTYYTMDYFKKLLPKANFYFIMGADLLVDIADGKWKMSEELVSENQFIVMARNGIDMLQAISRSPLLRNYDDGRFQLLDKGLAMEISSTYIREEFARGGEPRYLLPDACYDYIKNHHLYKR
ncbi:nicotinate (nicotinamide) nucleotide adenylyltransferase [Priestia flexa]|uniref:Probable nicotinate-nucleotide adenylyltransferase n=1 Tax=Priestia flexa TaxID=86664 RepID=A0A8I1SMY0_9BACI|nr:nicotinate (nicotinamide) nucleotide adenylyltransferase [Priestia flexa]MBN8251465.1 nicotinate (nicotinamide) nucleotide adenylyltransferase [Priestia flexa]MBN8434271.1 nicotinate (nicotinamide) nucleotide adenylyltransferase [Priestia flexa]MCA0966945.1 nicotinate (nicotinamide) nucleotide adenylyltransferase [Priestia flexa]RIV13656.1 nicotinate (nicotinamide) nucleotide adenylyltransferase [Priestia flexa]UIR31640.1 nicotinate (nicotinamide) nucleotide adenylyltransferase [Priestia fl